MSAEFLFTTIEQLKKQARIDPDFTDEDGLLGIYLRSAEETVLNYVERSPRDVLETYGFFPASFTQAALLIAADDYAYREGGRPSGVGRVCDGITHLLNPYRKVVI